MATVTIPDVELVSAGTWDASTGRSTITPDDLASAVQAFSDHLIDKPAVKIGHTDPRFSDGNHDGAPAFGWIDNIRTSPDGQKLLGDLVGVPAKLAGIMAAAYRRRSVEMSFGVRTAAGKVYRAAVTGLALLGATAPAVKNLADVYALYSAGNTVDHSSAILIGSEQPEATDAQVMAAAAASIGWEHLLPAAPAAPAQLSAEDQMMAAAAASIGFQLPATQQLEQLSPEDQIMQAAAASLGWTYDTTTKGLTR